MQVRDRVQRAIRIIYPPRCLGCGGVVQSDFGLCGACWRDMWFIVRPFCDLCGAPLPGHRDMPNAPCDDCLTHQHPWTQGRAAIRYKDMGRKLVMGLKHGDRMDIVPFAAKWMARAGADLINSETIIAPIPLHRLRLLQRRYNQAALLAQALGQQVQTPVCPDLLWRRKHTPMLEDATVNTRFTLLSNAIIAHPKRVARMRNKRVILVDDVMTTGATLSVASLACLDAGAKEVCIITLARAVKDA